MVLMSGFYPVADTYAVLDGHDIQRTHKSITALVVVESEFGRDLRFYRWELRKGEWKVDLTRMSGRPWDWDALAAKAFEFRLRYKLHSNDRA